MKTIVVQAGHNPPREPGFESGTGTRGEIEYAANVQKALGQMLVADGRFTYVPKPGKIEANTKCDLFLSIHADGSPNQAASGYCFGFPSHPTNARFASILAEEIEKIPGHPPHRRDNYTEDLRGYYGFRRVSTTGPEVLHEGGFLTNPGERLWMNANISRIANAQYVAICRWFGWPTMADAANKKRLAALRKWILDPVQQSKGWKWIKTTPNWREFRRRGGK